MKTNKTNKTNKNKPSPRLVHLGEAVGERLEKIYPNAECALDYRGDPWRLFVMARLSAQCTDKRVNEVSPALFAEIPDAAAAAEIPVERLEELVRSCGLYREKAKNIKESAKIIVEKHGGAIPDTEEELLALPGVGRKIANLLLGDLHGRGGMVCDTHCMRICGRLGFYEEGLKDPTKCERIMNPIIPMEKRADFCHRIVFFGREYCTARGNDCTKCPLNDLCAAGKKIK